MGRRSRDRLVVVRCGWAAPFAGDDARLSRWPPPRAELPVGPMLYIIDGPTRGRSWSGAAVRSEFRRDRCRSACRFQRARVWPVTSAAPATLSPLVKALRASTPVPATTPLRNGCRRLFGAFGHRSCDRPGAPQADPLTAHREHRIGRMRAVGPAPGRLPPGMKRSCRRRPNRPPAAARGLVSVR
jgi:hypothetical protein